VTDGSQRLAERADALRNAFDRSFAAPRRIDQAPMADFLAIRAGAQACALQFAEIGGLYSDRKITRVPGAAQRLLGLAGFRGAIMPVYSLAAILDAPTSDTPHWLVVASGAPVAFAFEAFEFHLRVPRTAIAPREAGARASDYVREFVRAPDTVRPIVNLAAILDAIRSETADPASRMER